MSPVPKPGKSTDIPLDIVEKINMLPISTEGCLNSDGTPYPQITYGKESFDNSFSLESMMAVESNMTVYETEEASGLLSFYHISYHYIGMIGYLVSLTSGKCPPDIYERSYDIVFRSAGEYDLLLC